MLSLEFRGFQDNDSDKNDQSSKNGADNEVHYDQNYQRGKY